MSCKPRAIVVLNPCACGGTAATRFQAVRSHLEQSFDLFILETNPTGDWVEQLCSALQTGNRFIVTAGGDGTASAVITTIVENGVPLREIILGAIGLGSSNDLHKPVAARLSGIPIRLDDKGKSPRDVGRIQYWNANEQRSERYFLVSGSVGMTAQANAFFNKGDVVLRRLKPIWTDFAVLYAALRTIWRYDTPDISVYIGGRRIRQTIANLSIMKTPYLAGAFKFDTPVDPASGKFAVNLCPQASRWFHLVVLANLLFNRFLTLERVSHWDDGSVELASDSPVPIEVDGEVVVATRAVFDILPERIWICR